MDLSLSTSKLNGSVAITPSIDVIRINVDGVNRHDVRFSWLLWVVTIGTISKAIQKTITKNINK